MPQVDELNTLFQQHLVEHYASIISSTTPPANKAPKNVCQVLPFIGKQPKEDKLALVVVDGMNFWQSQMLVNSLKNKYFDINAQTDVIYSWLPSVTELSRQEMCIRDRLLRINIPTKALSSLLTRCFSSFASVQNRVTSKVSCPCFKLWGRRATTQSSCLCAACKH